VTQEEARRRILSQQGLIKRFDEPLKAVRSLIAVQTQYPASVGPAIAARAKGVSARWLKEQLEKKRVLLKGWSVRNTLHTHLADDHLMLVAAMRRPRTANHARWMNSYPGMEAGMLEELHRQILEALATGSMSRRQLHECVPFYKGLPMVGWGLDVMGLAAEGKVVLSRQAAANTEFSRLDLWKPELQPCALTEQQALQEMARRYFAAYGPATFGDFAYWSGLAVSFIREAFQKVEPELVSTEIDGKKGVHYFLDGNGTIETGKLPLRLLPKFDVLLMGHKDKSLFLSDELKPMVFRKAGQVEATVLLDGRVKGTWRSAPAGKRLDFIIEPYARISSLAEKAIAREAKVVAKSLGFAECSVRIKALGEHLHL
jgi:hypothetical protein